MRPPPSDLCSLKKLLLEGQSLGKITYTTK